MSGDGWRPRESFSAGKTEDGTDAEGHYPEK